MAEVLWSEPIQIQRVNKMEAQHLSRCAIMTVWDFFRIVDLELGADMFLSLVLGRGWRSGGLPETALTRRAMEQRVQGRAPLPGRLARAITMAVNA